MGVFSSKIVKMFNVLFYAQKVSSGMGLLHPKFLGASGTGTSQKRGAKGVRRGPEKSSYCCEMLIIIHGSGIKNRNKIVSKI